MVGRPAARTSPLVQRNRLLSPAEPGIHIKDGGVGDLVRQEFILVNLVEPVDCAVEVRAPVGASDEGGVGDVVEGNAEAAHLVREGFGEGELAAGAEGFEGHVVEDCGEGGGGGFGLEPEEEAVGFRPRAEGVEEEEGGGVGERIGEGFVEVFVGGERAGEEGEVAVVEVVGVGGAGVAVGEEDLGFGFGRIGPDWGRFVMREEERGGLFEESEGEGAELVGEGRVRVRVGNGRGGRRG